MTIKQAYELGFRIALSKIAKKITGGGAPGQFVGMNPAWTPHTLGMAAGMVGRGAPSGRAGGGTGAISGATRAAYNAVPAVAMDPRQRGMAAGMVGRGAPSGRAGGGTGAVTGAAAVTAPGAAVATSTPRPVVPHPAI